MNKTCWFVLLLGALGCCSTAAAQDVTLVVNKSVQIPQIKRADVRAIFTGEKTTFADKSHATPVILKGGPANEVFLENYCGESAEEFRAQWRKLIFSGQGTMPKSFDSESALLDYVATTPGAIGYVARIPHQDNVKTLTASK